MRKVGFVVAGLMIGALVALALAKPQSPMARAIDTQGLQLMGVIFVAVPVGALVGAVLGLLVARITGR